MMQKHLVSVCPERAADTSLAQMSCQRNLAPEVFGRKKRAGGACRFAPASRSRRAGAAPPQPPPRAPVRRENAATAAGSSLRGELPRLHGAQASPWSVVGQTLAHVASFLPLVHPGFCRNSLPLLPPGGKQSQRPLRFRHRRTDGHVEQLAWSHDGEEAVHVIEHGQEHLRLSGGCRLQRAQQARCSSTVALRVRCCSMRRCLLDAMKPHLDAT